MAAPPATQSDRRDGLSYNLAKSRFLLVGTSRYEHLAELKAVGHNLDAMERILLEKSIIGVPSENIHVVRNPEDKAQISKAFIEAADGAEDLLFFYFAGHGLLGQSNRLFLSTVESNQDRCEHNAFAFEEVRTRLAKSPPQRRIIILDCCFSGNAIDETMGALTKIVDDNIELIEPPDTDVKSSFEIASVPPNRLAMAPSGMRFTAFTGELIRLLELGIDCSDRYLSIETIYDTLRQRIQQMGLPEPRCKSVYQGGRIIFARNRFGLAGASASDLQRVVEASLSFVQVRLDNISTDISNRFDNLAKQIPSQRRPHLKNFPSIGSPSYNYDSNRSTFAARLSEAVFGSLLAAFILGFVGFVAVYLQSAGRIGSPTELAQGVDTLARVSLYPDGIVMLQYLAISVQFSFYTALMYFNYHQSIMYLSSDQRKTAVDFIISVVIGLLYGISMLFPLATIFCIGVVTTAVLFRKYSLLRPYWLHLAHQLGKIQIDLDPTRGTSQSEDKRHGRRAVAKALLAKDNSPVLRSWGSSGGILAWAVACIMWVGPLAGWAYARYYNVQWASDQTIMANTAVIGIVAAFLFVALWRATMAMPSKQEDEAEKLDDELDQVLNKLVGRAQGP
jgi:hypothetical protein